MVIRLLLHCLMSEKPKWSFAYLYSVNGCCSLTQVGRPEFPERDNRVYNYFFFFFFFYKSLKEEAEEWRELRAERWWEGEGVQSETTGVEPALQLALTCVSPAEAERRVAGPLHGHGPDVELLVGGVVTRAAGGDLSLDAQHVARLTGGQTSHKVTARHFTSRGHSQYLSAKVTFTIPLCLS